MKTLYYNNPAAPEVQQVKAVLAFLDLNVAYETVKKIDGLFLKVDGKYLKGADTIGRFLAQGQKLGGEDE